MQEFNPEEHNENQKPAGSFLKGLNPFAYVIVVLAVIFFLYQFIGGALALAAGDMSLDNPNVKITRIILAFGQFMFILAPAIFFARLQTPNLKEIFRLNKPKPVLVILAVLGIVMIQPFLQGYMYFQEQLINSVPFLNDGLKPLRDLFNTFEQSTMKIVQAHSWFEFSVVVFVICITPAIFGNTHNRVPLCRLSLPAVQYRAAFDIGFLSRVHSLLFQLTVYWYPCTLPE